MITRELKQQDSVLPIIGTLSINFLTDSRYHFHFRPERQQIYQLVQLAAAMAVDLELKKLSINSESKRTLAGCYYLSSWYPELLP